MRHVPGAGTALRGGSAGGGTAETPSSCTRKGDRGGPCGGLGGGGAAAQPAIPRTTRTLAHRSTLALEAIARDPSTPCIEAPPSCPPRGQLGVRPSPLPRAPARDLDGEQVD